MKGGKGGWEGEKNIVPHKFSLKNVFWYKNKHKGFWFHLIQIVFVRCVRTFVLFAVNLASGFIRGGAFVC